MEQIFDRLFEIFNAEYIFSVIVASYLVIKCLDLLNGDSIVPSWAKKVITAVVGGIFIILFRKYSDSGVPCLMASYFAAIFVYDVAIKWLIQKFNIDYRK